MRIKKVNNKDGITLIALVVTIIVLLILATVGISLIVRNNGLFERAVKGKEVYKSGEYYDLIEMARGEVIIDEIGEITLDKLIKQIYEDKIVPEGNIKKLDEERARILTKEGYVFIITVDRTEYIGQNVGETPPELKEGDIKINIKPSEWTKENVKIEIENNVQGDFELKYIILPNELTEEEENKLKDARKWNRYKGTIETDKNITIYAALVNSMGEMSSSASRKITIIDKLEPEEIEPEIEVTTNSIKIKVENAKDREATKEYGESGLAEIWFSKDNGSTWQIDEKDKGKKEYTYNGLTQNTEYQIKVKIIDNAKNETITEQKNITTGRIQEATGNITFGTPIWNESTHKASISLSTDVGYQIQYYVGETSTISNSTKWQTGTNVTNLNHDSVVNARLWDGNNEGSYVSYTVKDSTKPTITVNITEITTNSITASANAQDKEWGMPDSVIYTFDIKEKGAADSTYTQSKTGSTATFTGLIQGKEYTVRAQTSDKAGNLGLGTKDAETEKKIELSGSIVFDAPVWNKDTHKASIKISTDSSYNIQYYIGNTNTITPQTQWENGTVAEGLENNTIVSARLFDGTNYSNYSSFVVKDSTNPTLTLTISSTDYTQLKIKATAIDNESGIVAGNSITLKIKSRK